MRYLFLYTTVPKRRDALKISNQLVKKRLIACVNIFPIDSIYWWQGKIEEAKEYGLIFKTRLENYQKIEEELKKIHLYDVPCLVGFEVKRGYKKYLDWISSSTICP